MFTQLYALLKLNIRALPYFVACLIILLSLPTSVIALSADQKKLFKDQIHYFDYDKGVCGGTATTADVSGDQSQAANAQIVIGVAKTYNLGREGALVGLMVGLAESGLRNYANKGVPVSMQNPAWLAIAEPRPLGNDHDSVGIMQQRVSTGWSTFGNGPTQEVTWQLMDPAYAAQAFFGTPSGAKLPEGLKQPSALRKGLQNLKGDWRTMDPGVAAQRVQISAVPDAYNKRKTQAQSLLNKYWDSAEAIPLPIPITGGTATQSTGLGCTAGTGSEAILQKIFEYAWPTYRRAGSANATVGKPEYLTAFRAAADKGEYLGDLCGFSVKFSNRVGADCGAFVTRVMRDSGADPEYNKYEGNTTGQLKYLREQAAAGKYTKVPDSEELQGGDIAIKDGHTYFFVGKMTGPEGQAFNGPTASASQCSRAPMAGPNDSRGDYEWYRLNQATGD